MQPYDNKNLKFTRSFGGPLRRRFGDKTLLLKRFDDLRDTLLNSLLVGTDVDLGVKGLLVGGSDAGEFLNLTGPRLLVEPLGIAFLGHVDWNVDEDFDEGDGLDGSALGDLLVQVPGDLAVLPVGRDKGGDGNGGGVGEELGNLADAADVLVAVGLGKAEVLVQAEAHVVAVEAVGGESKVQEVLLKRRGDGGFSRGREPREPDREALLAAEAETLLP